MINRITKNGGEGKHQFWVQMFILLYRIHQSQGNKALHFYVIRTQNLNFSMMNCMILNVIKINTNLKSLSTFNPFILNTKINSYTNGSKQIQQTRYFNIWSNKDRNLQKRAFSIFFETPEDKDFANSFFFCSLFVGFFLPT